MGRPRQYGSEQERRAARLKAQAKRRRGEAETLAGAVEMKPKPAECEAETLDDEVPEARTHGFVSFADCPDVPHDCKADPWIGAGRGTARTHKGRRFVLVARGTADLDAPEHGVVKEADWLARLAQTCEHGLKGWACHEC